MGMRGVGTCNAGTASRKRELSFMMVSFMSSVQVWGQDQIPTRPCHDVSLS